MHRAVTKATWLYPALELERSMKVQAPSLVEQRPFILPFARENMETLPIGDTDLTREAGFAEVLQHGLTAFCMCALQTQHRYSLS